MKKVSMIADRASMKRLLTFDFCSVVSSSQPPFQLQISHRVVSCRICRSWYKDQTLHGMCKIEYMSPPALFLPSLPLNGRVTLRCLSPFNATQIQRPCSSSRTEPNGLHQWTVPLTHPSHPSNSHASSVLASCLVPLARVRAGPLSGPWRIKAVSDSHTWTTAALPEGRDELDHMPRLR